MKPSLKRKKEGWQGKGPEQGEETGMVQGKRRITFRILNQINSAPFLFQSVSQNTLVTFKSTFLHFLRAVEAAQLVKYLLNNNEDLGSDPVHPCTKP